MPKKILEIWELEAAQMLAGMLLLRSGSRLKADIDDHEHLPITFGVCFPPVSGLTLARSALRVSAGGASGVVARWRRPAP